MRLVGVRDREGPATVRGPRLGAPGGTPDTWGEEK